mmetsp:Transcript_10971/g.25471  ORF Transcript_10971/g.25471 Transcript_10971/m.25471 type:complete len:93 (+) Transcript_10971:202-480(+)
MDSNSRTIPHLAVQSILDGMTRSFVLPQCELILHGYEWGRVVIPKNSRQNTLLYCQLRRKFMLDTLSRRNTATGFGVLWQSGIDMKAITKQC